MANYGDGFKREEMPKIRGDYRVEIIKAEDAISKTSGNPMIIITVQPNGTKAKINHYIVKNDYFNRNMTEFFDSFNIDFGDFDLPTWAGAIGAAQIFVDEQGYSKVKRFIHRSLQDKLPAWQGDTPERQIPTALDGEAVDSEDLPF